MIKQRSKFNKKTVRVLTDPQPVFVSLVRHGANQTPLKVIKNVEEIMNINDLPEFKDLVSKESVNLEDLAVMDNYSNVAVEKFLFSVEDYKSEKQVIDYLETKGYVDYSVNLAEDKNHFVVSSKDSVSFKQDSIKSIKVNDSIDVFLGVIDDAVDSDEGHNDTSVEKEQTEKKQVDDHCEKSRKRKSDNCLLNVKGLTSYQIMRKYDQHAATYSNGKTLADVMNHGADGLPIGFSEIVYALIATIRNNILDGDMDNVRNVTKEFSDLVISLAEAFMPATVPSEVVKEVFAAPSATKESGESLSLGGDNLKEDVVDCVKQEKEPTPSTEQEKTVETKKEVSEESQFNDEAFSTLKSFIESSLATVTEEFSKGLKDINDTVTKQGERVVALETAQQSRKSVAIGDIVEEDCQKPVKSSKNDDRYLRNQLGFMRKAT